MKLIEKLAGEAAEKSEWPDGDSYRNAYKEGFRAGFRKCREMAADLVERNQYDSKTVARDVLPNLGEEET